VDWHAWRHENMAKEGAPGYGEIVVGPIPIQSTSSIEGVSFVNQASFVYALLTHFVQFPVRQKNLRSVN
jgi:hypothetical protein